MLVAAAHAAGLLAIGWIAQHKRVEPVERPIEVALIQAEALRPPTPPPPAPPPPMPEVRQPAPPAPPKVQARPQPRPQPVVKQASVAPAPASTSPSAIRAEAPTAPPAPAVAAPAPAPAAPPAPAPVTAARFDAEYLNNPAPPYPPLSRRLREEGKVMLKVLVSAAGLPERIELARSSGSERLDRAAEDAVRRWKFVAARQGEQSIESWVLVPIIFKLQES
ncbi:MAG: energy transducer TonB [Proteobacteria bacterium]|nr:energy transducer TonB [Pseudomonadota bacterium]